MSDALGPIEDYQTDRQITMGRNLALVWMAQKRHEKALPLLTDLLTTAKRVMPTDHHRFGLLKHSQGRCLMEMGRLNDAEEPLLAGYDIIKTKLGNDHVQAQHALTDLIDLMKKMDRADAVETLASSVVENE